MSVMVSWRLAVGSLRAHRTRSLLTTLGVVIGVFIIALVLIVSDGLHASISRQSQELDNNILLIRPSTDGATGMEAFSPLRVLNATTLSNKDVAAVAKIVGEDNVAPMMFLGSTTKSGSTSYDNITTVASSHNLQKILDLKMQSGDWFSAQESSRNWVILGNKLAAGLIGTEYVMDQTVQIKGQTFTVIGILEKTDQPVSLAGVDIDKAAFISMENGTKFTNKTEQIGQIVVRAENTDLTKLSQEITSALNVNHLDGSEISVMQADEVVSASLGWLSTITTGALIFASVSLLVGGIGIMNIMLVSVAERIREIGIRKAVGATKRQILDQFLLEALIMTLSGAVIGLALAYAIGYLVGLQFSLPLTFSWWIFAISLGAPLAVGLFFGLWPAIHASRQDPIVALRQYQ